MFDVCVDRVEIAYITGEELFTTSEYQYYEFRAIDRPLTETQKSKISALSSRARVTSHTASFVYNYGDFKGNPE